MRPAVLLLALALAGCTGGHEHGGALDSGEIAPGASATLAFTEAGTHPMHCHPHPWMTQTVTVVEGGPTNATVRILDAMGDDAGYRFEPAELTVGIGALVTYVNEGNFTHTATMGEP